MLITGFNDLTNPELRLWDWAKDVMDQLKMNEHGKAVEMYKEFREMVLLPREPDTRGSLLVEFGKWCAPKLEALCGKEGAKLKSVKVGTWHREVGRSLYCTTQTTQDLTRLP